MQKKNRLTEMKILPSDIPRMFASTFVANQLAKTSARIPKFQRVLAHRESLSKTQQDADSDHVKLILMGDPKVT